MDSVQYIRASRWSAVPTAPGVYWWYFPEGCLDLFCIRELCDFTSLKLRRSTTGKVCLYHGMATSLRERIRWHSAQKLAMSALRSGFLSTFRLTLLALNDFDYDAGEGEINSFMDELEVEWRTHETVAEAEAAEAAELSGVFHYPLNIQSNRKPELARFTRYLQDTRRSYRARSLPNVSTPTRTVRTGPEGNVQVVEGRLEPPVLALISCTKSKASQACAVAELYQPSTFFRLAYEFAGLHATSRLILSAKHGVVRPDQVIEPYEQTLVGASREERRRWAGMVHKQLLDSPEYQGAKTLLWLAGENYRSELLPLLGADGKRTAIPLAGLAQGKQLSWLRAALGANEAELPDQDDATMTEIAQPAQRERSGWLTGLRHNALRFVRSLGGVTPQVSLSRGSLPATPAKKRERPVAPPSQRPARAAAEPRVSVPVADDFRRELMRIKEAARSRGAREIEITAGQLHRAVGGYPGPAHRMPVCCSVMRQEMSATDRIVAQPPKGNGASLCIAYRVG
jgi:hypothetical protein